MKYGPYNYGNKAKQYGTSQTVSMHEFETFPQSCFKLINVLQIHWQSSGSQCKVLSLLEEAPSNLLHHCCLQTSGLPSTEGITVSVNVYDLVSSLTNVITYCRRVYIVMIVLSCVQRRERQITVILSNVVRTDDVVQGANRWTSSQINLRLILTTIIKN